MATVDDLLRRLHRRVARLGPREGCSASARFDSYLRGWGTLATQSRRTLGYLRPLPEDLELSRLLTHLSRQTGTSTNASSLTSISLMIGALGDLLAGMPHAVDGSSQSDRLRLRADLHAALHAVARATLALGQESGRKEARGLLARLADATELAALLPPLARVSSLDRLTVPRYSPDTVDGAVGLWGHHARRLLGDRLLVTGLVLTDTAATLAVLCSDAAGHLRATHESRAAEAAGFAADRLGDAAVAWHRAARWPANVQLGGRQPDYRQTTKRVRDALRTPRFTYLPRPRRLRMLRDAIAAAQTIGDLQAETVERLANLRGLWVSHTRTNLRPANLRPRNTTDWSCLEWTHPERERLVKEALAAARALTRASASLDSAVLFTPAADWYPSPLVLVGGRITLPTPGPQGQAVPAT